MHRLARFIAGRARVSGVNPSYVSAEIGDVGEDTLVVQFDRPITSPVGDYQSGVTITEDSVEMTIGSYQKVDNIYVRYVLTATTGIANVIEWAYERALGTICAVVGGAPLLDVTARTVTNNIGTHFWFNSAEESGHLIHMP